MSYTHTSTHQHIGTQTHAATTYILKPCVMCSGGNGEATELAEQARISSEHRSIEREKKSLNYLFQISSLVYESETYCVWLRSVSYATQLILTLFET